MRQLIFLGLVILLASFTIDRQTCPTCWGKGKVAHQEAADIDYDFYPSKKPVPKTTTVIIECPTCHGSGTYIPPPPTCACSTCNGSGKEDFPCDNCPSGTTKVQCSKCHGSGRVQC